MQSANVNMLNVKRYELVIKVDLHVTSLTEFKMPAGPGQPELPRYRQQ